MNIMGEIPRFKKQCQEKKVQICISLFVSPLDPVPDPVPLLERLPPSSVGLVRLVVAHVVVVGNQVGAEI